MFSYSSRGHTETVSGCVFLNTQQDGSKTFASCSHDSSTMYWKEGCISPITRKEVNDGTLTSLCPLGPHPHRNGNNIQLDIKSTFHLLFFLHIEISLPPSSAVPEPSRGCWFYTYSILKKDRQMSMFSIASHLRESHTLRLLHQFDWTRKEKL